MLNIWDPLTIHVMRTARLSSDQFLAIFTAWFALKADGSTIDLPKPESRSESAARSRMLKNLERRGYIVRLASGPTHRRTDGYTLTPTALEWFDGIFAKPTG